MNTCCVTHEAVSKSRKAVARAARTHGRVYVTGCAANLASAFAGARGQRRGRLGAQRGDAGRRRRRRRCGRLRPSRRSPRACARLRQDPGRLQLLVRLLRRPARPRARAQPACRRSARQRSSAASRRVTARSSSPGSTWAATATARLATTSPRLVRAAAAIAGLARLRLSSIEVNHVGSELERALRETPNVARPPARAAAVGRRPRPAARWGGATAPPRYLRRLEPLQRLQPDDRRDRRVPGRGRARVRGHASGRPVGEHHEGARVPVLAAAGHGDRGARHRSGRGQEGAQRPAASALAGSRARSVGGPSSARRTSSSSIAPAAATATTTRRGSSRRRSASSSARAPPQATEEGILAA